MTDFEIEKANCEIAEFMGFTRQQGDYGFEYRPPNSAFSGVPVHKLAYNTSWDWLIPVKERIEQLGYSSVIGYNSPKGFYWASFFQGNEFQRKEIKSHEGETDESEISVLWKLIVKFIKWHNQHKQL